MSSPAFSYTFEGYTFDRPKKVEGEVYRLRNGMCSADFRTITVDLDEKSILDRAHKIVPKNDRYIEATTQYALTLPSWRENVIVKTSDGVPMIWFVKNGMTIWPFGSQAAKASLKAVRQLTGAFAPPREYGKKVEEQSVLWWARGCEYGAYHFEYNILQNNQLGAMISTGADRSTRYIRKAVQDYLSLTSWEHDVAAAWLEALAPQVYQRYNRRYKEVRDKIGPLDVGESGCFLSKSVSINTIDDPHRDVKEVKDGLVLTYPWDNFTGGDQIYLEVGMRFHQQAGDLLVAPSQLLTHLGLKIKSGQRVGHTFSMSQKIYSLSEGRFFCDECGKGYSGSKGLLYHKAHVHLKDDQGVALDAPRFYCHVPGCKRKGARKGYSTRQTLANHVEQDHPGFQPLQNFADMTRPPTKADTVATKEIEII